MENNQISEILTYTLIILVGILLILGFVFIKLSLKDKKIKKENKKVENKKDTETKTNKSSNSQIGSVLDFMNFETVEDNMIIIKSEQKYVMVIECQGVNYDLMSNLEKTGVEEGFLQFLNTLRHPIQLYVQTRTINLEKSIEEYNKYLKQIELTYNRKKIQYEEIYKDPSISREKKQKALYELIKSQNLYEYGKDIIKDTERLSLNKNIMNKKYYIVISYFHEAQNTSLSYDKEEIRNIAFSDLYTKAQAIIRTLSSTGVNGKILNSIELVDLLYMAYNRDGAESFGIERALKASYDKIYSTSTDIFDKKMRILDKEIEEKAIQRAQESLLKAKREKEIEIAKKEQEKDKLIDDLAKIILKENKKYVEKDLINKAIQSIDNEGGKVNEEKK